MSDGKATDKAYSFFSHTDCEYFPCHKFKDTENFNCLFCYCPLYLTGTECGGNFKYTKNGVKDCTDCSIPHRRENYSYIISRFKKHCAENPACKQNNQIKIKLLRSSSIPPTYASVGAAGADIFADINENIEILPHSTVLIPSGFAIEIPVGYAGFVYPRSGLSTKRGLAPANKVGVIDSDYRGEVMISLHNHSNESASVAPGERIAQIIIAPVTTPAFKICDELSDTIRGGGGFGSTGSK